MSYYKPPVFPDEPYTASVYFNYSSLIDREQDGHLYLASELNATLNVLAGNGTENPLFSEGVVEFFKQYNSIACVTSPQSIDGYHCLFAPKKGHGLYAPAGGIFLQSKPDLRFSIEDTIEGIVTAKKAGREVIGLYRDYARPNSSRGKLFRAMKEQKIETVSDIHHVPERIMQLAKFRYEHPTAKNSHFIPE